MLNVLRCIHDTFENIYFENLFVFFSLINTPEARVQDSELVKLTYTCFDPSMIGRLRLVQFSDSPCICFKDSCGVLFRCRLGVHLHQFYGD